MEQSRIFQSQFGFSYQLYEAQIQSFSGEETNQKIEKQQKRFKIPELFELTFIWVVLLSFFIYCEEKCYLQEKL